MFLSMMSNKNYKYKQIIPLFLSSDDDDNDEGQ